MVALTQRAIGAGLGVTLVLGLGTATAAAQPQAQPTGGALAQAWGYVVSRHAQDVTYAPAPRDQGNSSGGVNTVTWTETGHYEVIMPGIASEASAVVVSPMGTSPRRCVVQLWQPDGPDELIDLACFTRKGIPADTRFVLTYLVMVGQNADSPPGIGYDWADQPGNPSGYLPARKYNSVIGSSNPVERLSQGSYRQAMNALGSPGGNVQVTAIADTAATCQATWGPAVSQEAIFVSCRATSATLTDQQFDVIFTDGAGLKGILGAPAAYLLAHRPLAASYTAESAHRFSTSGKAPTIVRLGVGRWVVTLRGMPLGGAAVVTPATAGAAMCAIASIEKGAKPQRVGVRCFAPNGDPKDIKFSLSYLR